jgi:hypothetical protein
MDMLMTVYLCVFLAGFVFLIVSFLFGFEGLNVEHHIDFTGHDVDNTISPSFFSAKVMACFLVGFGMGAIVSHSWISSWVIQQRQIIGLGIFIDGVFGLLSGIIIGFCAWSIIKFFLSQQSSSLFTNEKFVGLKAPLRVGIPQQGTGEITIEIEGQVRSLDVQSENGCQIVSGTNVEIIRISGNVGIVKII